jgi:hypothetical protein
VQRHDIGMIERRSGACLLEKSQFAFRIGRPGVRKDLDRNGAVKPRIGCPEDFPHSPGADHRIDLVGT